MKTNTEAKGMPHESAMFVVEETRQSGKVQDRFTFMDEAEAVQFFHDYKHGWSDFKVIEIDKNENFVRMVVFENAHLCG